MRDIGIGTWPFGVAAETPLEFPIALDRIVEWGYRAVDFGALPPHPSPKPGTDELDRVAEEFGSRSLKVSALVPFFGDLSLLDAGNHDQYVERFAESVAVCKALDCSVIRVDSVDSPEAGAETGTAIVIERIAAVWSRCADLAAAEGMTIAWEFEPCCVLNMPHEIYALLHELDRPGFGVLYDTAHAHVVAEVGARHTEPNRTLAGGQLELISEVRERIVHLHVLDSDGSINEVPGTTIHVPIGQGDVAFAPVIGALAATGVPTWTIDLCFWRDPAADAESSRVALEQLLDQYAQVVSQAEAARA